MPSITSAVHPRLASPSSRQVLRSPAASETARFLNQASLDRDAWPSPSRPNVAVMLREPSISNFIPFQSAIMACMLVCMFTLPQQSTIQAASSLVWPFTGHVNFPGLSMWSGAYDFALCIPSVGVRNHAERLSNTCITQATWFNMREEIVVYVNGRPLVLREDERPFKNMQVILPDAYRRPIPCNVK